MNRIKSKAFLTSIFLLFSLYSLAGPYISDGNIVYFVLIIAVIPIVVGVLFLITLNQSYLKKLKNGLVYFSAVLSLLCTAASIHITYEGGELGPLLTCYYAAMSLYFIVLFIYVYRKKNRGH